jgi:hypothetical protein
MGALIQTKGTQRLAKWFNNRFDDSAAGLAAARNVVSASCTLPAAFADSTLNLLTISDRFIAQNAVSGWPADGNDLLYPAATLATTTAAGGAAANTLNFTIPNGLAAIPTVIAAGAAVSSLDARKTIPKGTVVGAVSALAGKNFSVTLVDKNNAPVNVVVTTNGERISFAKGKHEKLVRRWRWYLGVDLKAENHDKIRNAIFIALDDTGGFTKISFQTVEDTQKVIVTPLAKLNNASDELDNDMTMQILLLTQSTTAPDRQDSQ